ncbi:hypothetical protein [Streptomyces lydicus]|uniref:hypothetical protein n=1 Tax=Streptomyces lydicus TaxID=47763 RepID=UPI0036E79A1A
MVFRRSTAGSGTEAGGEDRPASESERLLFGGRLRDDHAWSRHDGAFTELGLRAMVVRLPTCWRSPPGWRTGPTPGRCGWWPAPRRAGAWRRRSPW